MPTKKELETRIAELERGQNVLHERLSKIEFEAETDQDAEIPPYFQPNTTFMHPNAGDSLKGAVAHETDAVAIGEAIIVVLPDARVWMRSLHLVYKTGKRVLTLVLSSDTSWDQPVSGHLRDVDPDHIAHMITDCVPLYDLKKAFPKYRFYDINTPSALLPGPLEASETCDERPYEAHQRDEDVGF